MVAFVTKAPDDGVIGFFGMPLSVLTLPPDGWPHPVNSRSGGLFAPKREAMSGWAVLIRNDGAPCVYPLDDLRPHNIDAECWCRPFFVDGHIIVHNSMDQRETYERGRKPS